MGESDKFHGETLYHAVIKQIKARGLAGATTVRGIEGFGATNRIHTKRIECLSYDLPVTIEVIDYEEKINELVDALKDMITSGVMITMQDVEIIRYTHNLNTEKQQENKI